MYCSKCSRRFPNEVKFCPYCGSVLESDLQEVDLFGNQRNAQPLKEPTAQKPKKKKHRLRYFIMVVFIIVILLVAGFILYALFDTDSADNGTLSNDNANSVSTTAQADMLIADNSYFSAKYLRAEKSIDGAFNVFIQIENKSNIHEIFVLDEVYIDDVKANFTGSGIPQEVAPGKKINGAFVAFSDIDINSAYKLEFKIKCMNSNYNDVYTTNTIVISL